jgi:hypothetical protein
MWTHDLQGAGYGGEEGLVLAAGTVRRPHAATYRQYAPFALARPGPPSEVGGAPIRGSAQGGTKPAGPGQFAEPGWGKLVALLEVAIAPTPLTSDDGIA